MTGQVEQQRPYYYIILEPPLLSKTDLDEKPNLENRLIIFQFPIRPFHTTILYGLYNKIDILLLQHLPYYKYHCNQNHWTREIDYQSIRTLTANRTKIGVEIHNDHMCEQFKYRKIYNNLKNYLLLKFNFRMKQKKREKEAEKGGYKLCDTKIEPNYDHSSP